MPLIPVVWHEKFNYSGSQVAAYKSQLFKLAAANKQHVREGIFFFSRIEALFSFSQIASPEGFQEWLFSFLQYFFSTLFSFIYF